MDLAISEEFLSQAIGRNGQNVRLASELTGWKLNVMSEEDFSKKGEEESADIINLFTTELDVEEDLAAVLIEAGFSSIEELAYVPEDELLSVDVLDEETVKELRDRANDVLLTKALTSEEPLGGSVPAEDLLNMEGMTIEIAHQLAKNKIVTMEDLAECSIDEVTEVLDIEEEKAGQLIMTAREPWFVDSEDA